MNGDNIVLGETGDKSHIVSNSIYRKWHNYQNRGLHKNKTQTLPEFGDGGGVVTDS